MAPKAAAAKGKSGSSDHASYQDMITDAIINLKDRNGSSRSALKKYVKANNKISADAMFDSLFNRALRAGVEKGVFAQPKGASGGTKLAKKEPKPAAAKTEKKEKKATAAKPKKAASATKKTTTAKATKPKAAPKAKATKAAKPAKAKAAPKAKKPAATKAAPAVVDKPAVLGKTKSGRVTKTTAKTPAKKATPKKAAPKKATPKKAAA